MEWQLLLMRFFDKQSCWQAARWAVGCVKWGGRRPNPRGLQRCQLTTYQPSAAGWRIRCSCKNAPAHCRASVSATRAKQTSTGCLFTPRHVSRPLALHHLSSLQGDK